MDAPTTADQQDLSTAAAKFFPEITSVEMAAGSRSLAKVETPDGTFALRRWPQKTTRERVQYVQAVLAALNEFPFAPTLVRAGDGETVLKFKQHLFDAYTWLEGKPLRRPESSDRLSQPVSLPRNAGASTIEELTGAIAHMHTATKTLAGKRGGPVLPPDGLVTGAKSVWMQQRTRLRPIAHLTPNVQRWLRTGERALPLTEKVISTLSTEAEMEPVITHANLWPDHVLVQREAGQERVAGIVDFKEVVASTPLLDLAQIATHFNGWSDDSAEQVIGAYGNNASLTPAERRVLPAIATLDLIASTGRILIALHVELGSPNATESMRDAADSMLRSLEAATITLERLEGVNQPGPRKWVHRASRKGQPNKSAKSSDRPTKRPAKPRPVNK
jgi:Ser/Thr protein kinase RdoA (MazF antagonist)